MAVQLPSALMRETTRAAWLTGRRPEDVLEEALADWLAGYESAPVAAFAPTGRRADRTPGVRSKRRCRRCGRRSAVIRSASGVS